MPTTAQQVNTLIHALTSHQTAPVPILFGSTLHKLSFDYTPRSIAQLQQLFGQLSARGYRAEQLLAQTGGANFLLAIAGYLGDYLARSTDETIHWYDYTEASDEIAQQNAEHGTQFRLPVQFESSVVARIGASMYCQPLKVIPALLAGEPVLPAFIEAMQTAIFQQAQVNLIAEPNQVASDYLKWVRTGKLLNRQVAFFEALSAVNFDYSATSLAAIDTALTHIKTQYQFGADNYMSQVSEPSVQAFLYLLGFYIGMTSSRLANVAVKWANYDQMLAMLEDNTFVNCIEHSFVLLMENHYRTPILVVTNRLFDIAPQFPTTAVEFAEVIDQQNRGSLQVFQPAALYPLTNASETLPPLQRYAMQAAGRLLHRHLSAIKAGQSLAPQLFEGVLNPSTQRVNANLTALPSADDTAIDGLYHTLAQPDTALVQVASYEMMANLPTGRCDAIALEIRVHQTPALSLQLIVPYRPETPNEAMAIYPIVSNQSSLPEHSHALVALLHQSLLSLKDGQRWQSYIVDDFAPWAITPHQMQQLAQAHQPADNITIAVLPVAPLDDSAVTTTGLTLEIPAFDYTAHRWQGYDLPKYILEVPDNEREYLQVLTPDSLINDELFAQAEAIAQLYRRGKVVWAVVVDADTRLSSPDASMSYDASSPVLTAELLFDPTGQASVADMQRNAERLQQLRQQNIATLPQDQAFYAMHLQDGRSRLFNFPYPKTLADAPLVLSSVWVWRPHLPNGLLSAPIVPIVILPEGNSPVMILPAKFWPTAYYQYWLGLARQQFGEADGYDLMPKIRWQAQQGLQYAGKGLEARLFPKFKFTQTATTAHAAPPTTAPSPVSPMPTVPASPAPIANLPQINNTPIDNPRVTTSVTSLETPTTAINDNAFIAPDPIVTSAPTPSMPSTPSIPTGNAIAALSPELQQQLLRDQARLQSALSTQDKDKEKKLYMMGGALVVMMIVAMVMASLLR